MFKKIKEEHYLIAIYVVSIIVFAAMFFAFNYVENKQKKALYNFVYNQKIEQNKKDIRLETYAAISFIDSYTKLFISDTYVKLRDSLRIIKKEITQPVSNSQLERLSKENGVRLAVFNDNGSSNIDFISLKNCRPYKNNIISNFGDVALKICFSPTIKADQNSGKFLVASTKLDNSTTLIAYKPMLEIENKIMDYVFPKLKNFIFKDKNKDSYFFVVKILNLNGGKNFAMNIYNKSLGVRIGKVESSAGTDAKGNRYREKYIQGLKKYGETYSEYWYSSPTTNKPQLKISFRKYYKPLQWMVGTGFYVNRIKMKTDIFTEGMLNYIKTFQIALFVLYVLTLLAIYIINTEFFSVANEDTENITSKISEKIAEIKPIDIDSLHFERFKTIAITLNNFSKTLQLKEDKIEQNRIEFLKTFINIVEIRDIYTKGHSQRVAKYAQEIGKILNLSKQNQYDLYVSGLLHDIGKVAIPDSILLKPGKLSEYEYKIMKYHPEFSYDLVKNIEFFQYISTFIKQHHERCDGSGYPDGLKCEEITLEGKILAIADAFDALVTTRPYRKQFSISQAIAIMKNMPLDQSIINKIEPHLSDIYFEEKIEQNSLSSKIADIEESRITIFETDTFTGLYKIKLLIEYINDLIDNNIEFYLFMIDIKYLKKINYIFGYEKGDELILKFAKTINEIKDAHYKTRVGSNYFAFVYMGKKPLEIKKELEKRLNSIEIDNQKIGYFVTYLTSHNIKNAEELIYFAEMQIESMKFSAYKKESG